MNKLIYLLIFLFVNITPVHLWAQSKTTFGKSTGEYAELLTNLESQLTKKGNITIKLLGGKPRTIFVTWIRDQVHVMKAMKYLHPDMESFLEFFLINQTEEGLFYDYIMPLTYGSAGDRKNIFNKRYWKVFPEDSIQMHRLPVEADVEYLVVEGVYAAWQSSGDTAFIKKWLPSLEKGMHYSMHDPLRWSEKFGLVKRGYTLDTWDFMLLPAPRAEYTRNGGNVQKGIFDIDEKTPMGIMHGDNSGMLAAGRQLSNMFKAVGDAEKSTQWDKQAGIFRDKTNALCWNGKYYAHFVEVDKQPPYLKMDQRNTLSLSNPYDINRGLPTEKMAESILKTYQQLKETNKDHSFAEWYGVYPPVEPHFADYKPGSYMNGGVNTIVAGELAKAAFQHGFESYGIDILQRIINLIKKHNGDLPVAYTPEGKVDAGIPDNWGQAAVYSALVEGLAGIIDKSSGFHEVEISPRWLAAGKTTADVTIAYGPSGNAVSYKYVFDEAKRKITLNTGGSFHNSNVRILLPAKFGKVDAAVNKSRHQLRIEKVNQSSYVVISGIEGKDNVEISY